MHTLLTSAKEVCVQITKVKKMEISVQKCCNFALIISVTFHHSLMECDTDWHMIPQISGQTLIQE